MAEGRDVESLRFREMYIATFPSVFKYVFRRLKEDVDDVVEETYITAWRRRKDIPEDSDECQLWLFGIARRLMANRFRLRSHRSRFVRQMEPLTSNETNTEGAALASVLVHSALGKMRRRDREILLLVEWDGLTVDQSARVLAISPTAATKRLAVAREQFKTLCGNVETVA